MEIIEYRIVCLLGSFQSEVHGLSGVRVMLHDVSLIGLSIHIPLQSSSPLRSASPSLLIFSVIWNDSTVG